MTKCRLRYGSGLPCIVNADVNADPIDEKRKSKNLSIVLTLVQNLVSIKCEEPSGLANWLA